MILQFCAHVSFRVVALDAIFEQCRKDECCANGRESRYVSMPETHSTTSEVVNIAHRQQETKHGNKADQTQIYCSHV